MIEIVYLCFKQCEIFLCNYKRINVASLHYLVLIVIFMTTVTPFPSVDLAGRGGGSWYARLPSGLVSFIFMQFWHKSRQIIVFSPSQELAPFRLGNPGSATFLLCNLIRYAEQNEAGQFFNIIDEQ